MGSSRTACHQKGDDWRPRRKTNESETLLNPDTGPDYSPIHDDHPGAEEEWWERKRDLPRHMVDRGVTPRLATLRDRDDRPRMQWDQKMCSWKRLW
ncbi:Hypothetical predicted protein [Marmota monax]|uniref:Uncharacterized protein n=1 Tax=Marmota monax TaxID=9995 RepID=A0A5E4BTZ3_MARMO|nr:Hypothetical predicted protein [Marmota monax]